MATAITFQVDKLSTLVRQGVISAADITVGPTGFAVAGEIHMIPGMLREVNHVGLAGRYATRAAVALHKGRPVGIAVVSAEDPWYGGSGPGGAFNVLVHQDYRRRGIARRLTAEVLAVNTWPKLMASYRARDLLAETLPLIPEESPGPKFPAVYRAR